MFFYIFVLSTQFWAVHINVGGFFHKRKEKEELDKRIALEKEKSFRRNKLVNSERFQYSLNSAVEWYKVFNAVADKYENVFLQVCHYQYDSRYPILDHEKPRDSDKDRGIDKNYIYFDMLCSSDHMMWAKNCYYSYKNSGICDAQKFAFELFFSGHYDSINSALHATEYDCFDYFFEHVFEDPSYKDSRLIKGFWAGESFEDSKVFLEELYERCANIPSPARWPCYIKRTSQSKDDVENKAVTPATVVCREDSNKSLSKKSESVSVPAKATPNVSIKKKIKYDDGTFCTAIVSKGIRKFFYIMGLYRQAVITDNRNKKSCNLEEMAWFSKDGYYTYDITLQQDKKMWSINFKPYKSCYIMVYKGENVTSMYLPSGGKKTRIRIINTDTQNVEQDFDIMVT